MSNNYYDNCNQCNQPMRSGHRSGTCTLCRTNPCAFAGCETRVTKKINAVTYCSVHAHKSGNHRKIKDFGMVEV